MRRSAEGGRIQIRVRFIVSKHIGTNLGLLLRSREWGKMGAVQMETSVSSRCDCMSLQRVEES